MKTIEGYLIDKGQSYVNSLNSTPKLLLKKGIILACVTCVSIVGIIAALILVKFEIPETEADKMLIGFLALGSVSVFLVGVISIFGLLWDAFMSQYILRLEAEHDAAEAIETIQVLQDQSKKRVG